MADHCHMTDACKRFNNPPAKLLRLWRIIYCTAAMGILVGEPLSHRKGVPEEAKKFVELCDMMREAMMRLHPIPVWIANNIKKGFCDVIKEVWDKSARQNPITLLDVVALLCASAAFELAQLPSSEPVCKLLESMQSSAEGMREILMSIFYDKGEKDPEDPEGWDVVDATQRLEAYMFGVADKTKQPVSCYIIGDRFWVAAHSRQEARDYIHKLYGLVNLSVQGVALGMKLDDGRTVSELISTASSVPQIVARDGDN